MIEVISSLPAYLKFSEYDRALMLVSSFTAGSLRATLMDLATVAFTRFRAQTFVTDLWLPERGRFSCPHAGHRYAPCHAVDFFFSGGKAPDTDWPIRYLWENYPSENGISIEIVKSGTDSFYHLQAQIPPHPGFGNLAFTTENIRDEIERIEK